MPQPAGNWVVWIWFNLADTPALPEQKSHPSLGSSPDAPCWGAQGFSPVAFPAPFFCNCPHTALPSLSEPGFFHSNHICLKIEYVLVMDAQRGNVCLNEFQRTCNSVTQCHLSRGGGGVQRMLSSSSAAGAPAGESSISSSSGKTHTWTAGSVVFFPTGVYEGPVDYADIGATCGQASANPSPVQCSPPSLGGLP